MIAILIDAIDSELEKSVSVTGSISNEIAVLSDVTSPIALPISPFRELFSLICEACLVQYKDSLSNCPLCYGCGLPTCSISVKSSSAVEKAKSCIAPSGWDDLLAKTDTVRCDTFLQQSQDDSSSAVVCDEPNKIVETSVSATSSTDDSSHFYLDLLGRTRHSSKRRRVSHMPTSHPEQYIKKRVVGLFRKYPHQIFRGTVSSYRICNERLEPLFFIKYDDDDDEEVYYHDDNADEGRDLKTLLSLFDKYGEDE